MAETLHNTDLPELLQHAIRAAREAGKAIIQVYLSHDFEVSQKQDSSPLTLADKAAHHKINTHLGALGIPILSEEGADIPYQNRKHWPAYWLIDPLDGTKEFIKRNGEFTVNIALMRHNQPVAGVVYAPTSDKLYYGCIGSKAYVEENGNRSQLEPLPEKQTIEALQQQQLQRIVASRTHRNSETEDFISNFKNAHFSSMGSSLKFMLLAEGKADLYPRFAPTMEWDTAAAHAILKILNRNIYTVDMQGELIYNKPNLLNPSFICL